MGAVAAVLAGELFFAICENAADAEMRALNHIPAGESWLFTGSFVNPVSVRLAYRGPQAAPADFFQPDPELGYRLRANLRAVPAALRLAGKEIYGVTYSTQRFGWRVVPQGAANAPDVLFFGDSYVFGDGLADDQTLPSRFGAYMKGAATVHNFGVPGWGAQQSLRLLELHGEKAELEQGRPRKAFYLLIKDHLARLVDRRAVTSGSPRYVYREGKVVFDGNFPSPGAFARACDWSSLCHWLEMRWRERRDAGDEVGASPDHLAATLARMQELLHERYGIRLTVISWNPGDPLLDAVEHALAARNVDVVAVRDAIPGFPADPSVAYSFPYDGHPNAMAADQLARYLAERLGR